jgi:prevent-host-death family protein
MESIGAYEAKTHLAKLLERVAKGHCVAITRHGVPVAVLQPYGPQKGVDVGSVIAQLRDFREGNTLAELSIREMVEQGRR